jgi:hypothetical protein
LTQCRRRTRENGCRLTTLDIKTRSLKRATSVRSSLGFYASRGQALCFGPNLRGRERLDFLADNPLYTKRFAYFVGRCSRQATIKDGADELALDGARSRRPVLPHQSSTRPQEGDHGRRRLHPYRQRDDVSGPRPRSLRSRLHRPANRLLKRLADIGYAVETKPPEPCLWQRREFAVRSEQVSSFRAPAAHNPRHLRRGRRPKPFARGDIRPERSVLGCDGLTTRA